MTSNYLQYYILNVFRSYWTTFYKSKTSLKVLLGTEFTCMIKTKKVQTSTQRLSTSLLFWLNFSKTSAVVLSSEPRVWHIHKANIHSADTLFNLIRFSWMKYLQDQTKLLSYMCYLGNRYPRPVGISWSFLLCDVAMDVPQCAVLCLILRIQNKRKNKIHGILLLEDFVSLS